MTSFKLSETRPKPVQKKCPNIRSVRSVRFVRLSEYFDFYNILYINYLYIILFKNFYFQNILLDSSDSSDSYFTNSIYYLELMPFRAVKPNILKKGSKKELKPDIE
jgi:hypothetical protein